jgi:hypothetical protein
MTDLPLNFVLPDGMSRELAAQLTAYSLDQLIESKHDRWSYRLLIDGAEWIDLDGVRVLIPHFMTHADLQVVRRFIEVGGGAIVFELLATYDATAGPAAGVPERVLVVAERVPEQDFSIVTVYHDLE